MQLIFYMMLRTLFRPTFFGVTKYELIEKFNIFFRVSYSFVKMSGPQRYEIH